MAHGKSNENIVDVNKNIPQKTRSNRHNVQYHSRCPLVCARMYLESWSACFLCRIKNARPHFQMRCVISIMRKMLRKICTVRYGQRASALLVNAMIVPVNVFEIDAFKCKCGETFPTLYPSSIELSLRLISLFCSLYFIVFTF